MARHRRDSARLTSAGQRRDIPLPTRQPHPHSDQRPAWHENSGLDGWGRSRQHARSGDVRADAVQHDVRVQASGGQSIDRRERPAHLEGDAIRPRDDRNRSTPAHELGEPPIQGDRTGGLPLQVAPHRLAPTRVRLVELREVSRNLDRPTPAPQIGRQEEHASVINSADSRSTSIRDTTIFRPPRCFAKTFAKDHYRSSRADSAISFRCSSLVPSPTSSVFASSNNRPTSYSDEKPYPPCI